jgi:predicted CoA-binding protein
MENYKKKKIAIVGVSEDFQKFGYKIFRDLLKEGYDVEGINPKGGRIFEKKIYKSLNDLNRKPELVITVVPPSVTDKVVEDCIKLGIKEIWMQPGSEFKKAIEKALKNGVKVTSNQCFMVEEGIW